ncbi:MAG: MATE family efflux transporter [Bacteroidetes bacterium]|nr:MATE family efflux transporter [Bacteroidota bacterium]
MDKVLKGIWDAMKGTEKDFTSGSINRAIFLLSVPMVLEMVMESLFAVVDVFFVSQISVNAVATVGLTEAVLTVIYSIAFGLSMAATAMVARRIGEEDPEKASVAAAQSIIIAVVISCILGVSGFLFAEDILRLMGGDETLIAEGVGYTKIMFASNLIIMLLFLMNGIFRGAGDANLAMWTLWISNGLNIILDPCFIFGIGPFPELGVTGAAVATTIGRGVGVLFQLFIFFKGTSLVKVAWGHFMIKWEVIRKLIKVSSGGAGQHLISSCSWVFLMRIVSLFGSEVVAGYTIAIRLIIFTILPSWGMANAAATLVGQNLGAGKPERAETSVWRSAFFNMGFLTLTGVFFFLFAENFIRFFHHEERVVQAGVVSLQIICLGFVFFSYGMVLSQAFNGAGDTRTPTIINLFCFWLVEIPLAYLLAVSLQFGPSGVYWAIAVSEALLAITAIIVFKKGKWKLVNI